MFFNQNGILNIDEAIMNKESFKKIMADGTVTEDEIKDLLAETSVLYAVYNIYSIQSLNK